MRALPAPLLGAVDDAIVLAAGFGIAFVLVLPGAASTAFWVVAGLSLLRLPRRPAPLEPFERAWIAALLLMPLVAALSLIHSADPGHGAGRIEKFLRFAMTVPILLTWRTGLGARAVGLWPLFVGFGALFAGLVALGQVGFGDWERASGAVHPIFFGDVAAALAVLAAALALRADAPRRLLLAAAAGGLLAAVLSGTRNALLVLPVVALLAILQGGNRLGLRTWLAGAAGSAVVLVFGILFVPDLPAHFAIGAREILAWLEGGPSVQASSLGGRLELWELCLTLWREHPWIGGGIGDYLRDANALAEASGNSIFEVNPNLRDHAHSIYLQALVGQGMLGLLVLLAVLLLPLWRGWMLLRQATAKAEMALAAACLSPALCFLVFGIGESWTVKNSFISIYLLLQAPLLAFVSGPCRRAGAGEGRAAAV